MMSKLKIIVLSLGCTRYVKAAADDEDNIAGVDDIAEAACPAAAPAPVETYIDYDGGMWIRLPDGTERYISREERIINQRRRRRSRTVPRPTQPAAAPHIPTFLPPANTNAKSDDLHIVGGDTGSSREYSQHCDSSSSEESQPDNEEKSYEPEGFNVPPQRVCVYMKNQVPTNRKTGAIRVVSTIMKQRGDEFGLDGRPFQVCGMNVGQVFWIGNTSQVVTKVSEPGVSGVQESISYDDEVNRTFKVGDVVVCKSGRRTVPSVVVKQCVGGQLGLLNLFQRDWRGVRILLEPELQSLDVQDSEVCWFKPTKVNRPCQEIQTRTKVSRGVQHRVAELLKNDDFSQIESICMECTKREGWYKGYEILGDVYAKRGMIEKAVQAYQNARTAICNSDYPFEKLQKGRVISKQKKVIRNSPYSTFEEEKTSEAYASGQSSSFQFVSGEIESA